MGSPTRSPSLTLGSTVIHVFSELAFDQVPLWHYTVVATCGRTPITVFSVLPGRSEIPRAS